MGKFKTYSVQTQQNNIYPVCPPPSSSIHGLYGSPDEAKHYRPMFHECEVIGFDYKAQTPWKAEREFAKYFDGLTESERMQEHLRYCGSAPSTGA